jgi:transketolase
MTTCVEELEEIARDLRCLVLKMVYRAGSGHLGGSLSAADLVSALYFSVMNIDPKRPDWEERDRFILSKGHACPIVYAALARRGYYPEDELWTLRQVGSRLQGHPDMRKTPGIDATTGSLGQGVSIAIGMALAARLGAEPHRVYAMIGCGESQEGQIWEAAMSAAHYCLDSLTVVQDYNGFQIDGSNEDIMRVEPLSKKWDAFGWNVLQINGHNFAEILEAFSEARRVEGKPTVIIARTVKGKGISFMENTSKWHSGAPSAEQMEQALVELGCPGGMQ